jgi:hypothetical protein
MAGWPTFKRAARPGDAALLHQRVERQQQVQVKGPKVEMVDGVHRSDRFA